MSRGVIFFTEEFVQHIIVEWAKHQKMGVFHHKSLQSELSASLVNIGCGYVCVCIRA